MKTHKFNYAGQQRTMFLRPRGSWTLRLRVDGRDKWVSLKTSIKGSAEETAKSLLRAHAENTAQQFAAKLGYQPKGEVTLGNIVAAFAQAPLSLEKQSRRGYVWSLQHVIERVFGSETLWSTQSLSVLTEDLVYRYRNAVLKRAQELEGDGATLERHKRSANSALRQARALFSSHLLEHYRIACGLDLPDLAGWRSAPGFRGATKTDYSHPADDLIRSTLEELERTRALNTPRYLACWLAIGFGLRKSEVSALKGDSFTIINGRPHVELRTVTTMSGESNVTKNGSKCPRVPCANGAWERLAPLLEAAPAGGYLIAGTPTYRTEGVFREINDWLRTMGWKTQKGFHELRAYAGCQVAMRNGLLSASQWLRHGSVTTTQAYYGRYLNMTVEDQPLGLAPVFHLSPPARIREPAMA